MGTEAAPDRQPDGDEFAPRRPRSQAPHERFFEEGEEPPERYDQEDKLDDHFDPNWKVAPQKWAGRAQKPYWSFFKNSFWLFLIYGPLIAYGWWVCFISIYIVLEPLIFWILTRRALRQFNGTSQPAKDLRGYGSLLLLRFVTLSWEYIIGALGWGACAVLREAWLHYPLHEIVAGVILAPIVLPAAALKWRATRFAAILIVDKRAGPTEAVRLSWRMWEGRFWPLFGIELLIATMQFFAGYIFGIGLIFLTPFTMLFWTAAYLDIMYGPKALNESVEKQTDDAVETSMASPAANIPSPPNKETP